MQDATFRYLTSQLCRLGLTMAAATQPIASLLLLGWFAFIVLSGRPNLGANVYYNTNELQSLIVLGFGIFLGYLGLARRLPERTPLDWPAVAFVAAYALAVATSVNPRLSAEASLQIATCVVAFYIFSDPRVISTQVLSRGLVLVAAVLSYMALQEIGVMYREWKEAIDAIRGFSNSDLIPPPVQRTSNVLHHPNHLAMFLNLSLPFALLVALRPSVRIERPVAIAILVVGGIALFFTQSRGAWLGVLVSQPVFWTLVYFHTSRQQVPAVALRTWVRRNAQAAKVTGAVGLVLVSAAFAFIAITEPPWLFRETLSERFVAMAAAIRMFLDHPITGAGPFSYGLLNGQYGIEKPYGLTIVHNAYLQVLVEVGIVGALTFVFGGIMVVRSLRSAWMRAEPKERLVIATSVAAIIATLVHGLTDSPPAWNTVLLPFSIVLAIALRTAHSPPRSRAVRHAWTARTPQVLVVALVPLIAIGWWAFDGAHSHYNQSLRNFEAGNSVAATREAVMAADADLESLVYHLHAGVSLVSLSQSRDAAQWPNALEQGIEYLRGATEQDQYNALAHANLALALQLANDNDGAIAAAHRALEHSPSDPVIAIVAGSVFEQAGLTNKAIAAFARAIENDISLTQSPFWASRDARWEMRSAVLAASGADACALGRAAGTYGTYLEDIDRLAVDCRALVEAPGGSGKRASLALTLFAQGEVEAARLEGNRALASAGRTPDTLVMSAIVLADGNLSQVRSDLFSARSRADASALLPYTYTGEPFATALLNVPLPREHGPMPQLVNTRIASIMPRDSVSPEAAMTQYRAARFYFTHIALREAPKQKLIGGAWTEFVSPNVLLAFDALESD